MATIVPKGEDKKLKEKQNKISSTIAQYKSFYMGLMGRWNKDKMQKQCIATAQKFTTISKDGKTYKLTNYTPKEKDINMFCIVQNVRILKQCTTIDFSGLPIGNWGAFQVASLIAGVITSDKPVYTIETINLSGCGIDDVGGWTIIDMLNRLTPESKLRNIILDGNQIDADTAMTMMVKINDPTKNAIYKKMNISLLKNPIPDESRKIINSNANIKAYKLKF